MFQHQRVAPCGWWELSCYAVLTNTPLIFLVQMDREKFQHTVGRYRSRMVLNQRWGYKSANKVEHMTIHKRRLHSYQRVAHDSNYCTCRSLQNADKQSQRQSFVFIRLRSRRETMRGYLSLRCCLGLRNLSTKSWLTWPSVALHCRFRPYTFQVELFTVKSGLTLHVLKWSWADFPEHHDCMILYCVPKKCDHTFDDKLK